MKQNLERRNFIKKMGLGLPALAVLSVTSEAFSQTTEQTQIEIENRHGHELEIPMSDLMNSEVLEYDIQGRSRHGHLLVIEKSDIDAILRGEEVVLESSKNSRHTHIVRIQMNTALMSARG